MLTTEQFAAELTRLKLMYPSGYMPDEWDATVRTWEPKCAPFGAVVAQAVDQAGEQYKDRFPTMHQFLAICMDIYKANQKVTAESMRGKTLAQAQETMQEAVERLGTAVMKAGNGKLGDKITDDNQHKVESCLGTLANAYGLSAMREEPDGFLYERSMARILRDRGASPFSAIKGIAKCPEIFKKFPTAGMILDVVGGMTAGTWPEEYVR